MIHCTSIYLPLRLPCRHLACSAFEASSVGGPSRPPPARNAPWRAPWTRSAARAATDSPPPPRADNACDVVRVRNVSSPTTSTIGGAAQGGTGAQGAQGGAGAGNGGQDGGAQGGGGGQGQQGQGGNGERKGQAGVFSEENRQ